MESYLASVSGHQKGRYRPLDEATRRRIAEAWSRTFDEWGYPR